MSIIQRDALIRGNLLGQGGQGSVYQVTNRKINMQWNAVYKEYAPDVLPDLDSGALNEMADVIPGLAGADARWLCDKTAWPAGVVESGGRVTGFLMRAVPDQFQFDMTNIGVAAGSSRRLAGLEFLLNPDSYVGQIGLRVSQRDRLLLLADIAATVSRLHSMDIVIGDLSPKNLLFSTAPSPECFFIDCDAMRLRGADALPQMETPGWTVPAGEEPGTRASDAYKFALLATRVIARDQDATDPAVLAGVSSALGDLARKGLGPDQDQRPVLSAWVKELRDEARTAATAPAASPWRGGPGSVRNIPSSVRVTWQRQTRAARAAIVIGSSLAALLLILGIGSAGQGTTSVSNAGLPASTAPAGTAPADTGSGDQPADNSQPAMPSPSYSPSPSPSPTDALAGAQSGDCYYQTGGWKSADWHPQTSCQTGDFQVVQVISGTTDTSRCNNVPGADWEVPDLVGDQVLCMMYQNSSPAFAASLNQCVYGPPTSDSTWNMTSCSPGNFTVVGVYRGTTDSSRCGSNSDYAESFTVPGYSDLNEVLCLEMNFPLVVTAQQYACLWESGWGSSATFSNVSSCSAANVVVEGRINRINDSAFCGRYGSYTWYPRDYPGLGYTVCLGSPS